MTVIRLCFLLYHILAYYGRFLLSIQISKLLFNYIIYSGVGSDEFLANYIIVIHNVV